MIYPIVLAVQLYLALLPQWAPGGIQAGLSGDRDGEILNGTRWIQDNVHIDSIVPSIAYERDTSCMGVDFKA